MSGTMPGKGGAQDTIRDLRDRLAQTERQDPEAVAERIYRALWGKPEPSPLGTWWIRIRDFVRGHEELRPVVLEMNADLTALRLVRDEAEWVVHAVLHGVSKSGPDIGGATKEEAHDALLSLEEALAAVRGEEEKHD